MDLIFYFVINLLNTKIPIYRAVHNHSTLTSAVIFHHLENPDLSLSCILSSACKLLLSEKFELVLQILNVFQIDEAGRICNLCDLIDVVSD